MYKQDLALNNLHSWYAIKPNQPKALFHMDKTLLSDLHNVFHIHDIYVKQPINFKVAEHPSLLGVSSM